MKSVRRLLLPLLLAMIAGAAMGTGVTYPDGTVSPFPPAFIPMGIPAGFNESAVHGVAAKDGVIYGAVGYVRLAGGSETGAFLDKNGALSFFRDQSGSNVGAVYAISGDGKIKVGAGGYFDAENRYHPLADEGYGKAVGSISRDGSTIGGHVYLTDQDPTREQQEATLWAPGGTGFSRLGFLPGFAASSVYGLSADGQTVCGKSSRITDPSNGATEHRAFRLKQGGTMQMLPSLAPDDDTFANGSSRLGDLIVGVSGHTAVAWNDNGASQFSVFRLQSGGYGSDAEAIDDDASNIAGDTYTSDREYAAVLWNIYGNLRGTIKGLLASSYKISIGQWNPEVAVCISGDGYTAGGYGKNPKGYLEGWVAVLPPILHPPKIDPIAPQIVEARKPFHLLVAAKSDNATGSQTFSAAWLPPGFTISSNGEINGTWDGRNPSARTVTVTVTVKDPQGSASRSFQLVLSPGIDQLNQLIKGHGYLPLNKPPGEELFLASFGGALSGNGQVAVGHDGIGNDSRAYRWTQTDGISGLPMLPGALRDYGTALAASNDGNTIVGQAAAPPADDGSNRSVGVVWKTAPVAAKALKVTATTTYAVSETGTQLEAINIGLFAGGIISIANGVSADGSAAAGYGDATEKGINYQIFQAFRWTATDGMVGLGWLPGGRKFSEAFGVSPDGSTIVGVSDSAVGNQAFRWTQAEGMVGLGKLSGATFTRANAISANNSAIIGSGTVSGNNHAFRWTATEGLVDLGVLPGDQFSEATAISADGSIVVGRSGIFPTSRPFIWDRTNGMRDLEAVLVAGNPNLSDWTLKTADGISSDGKIVTGSGRNPNGDSEGYTGVLEVRPAQPLNISTRMRVLTGDKVLIAGFIITGSDPKKVLIRGIGPSLGSAGVAGALADPTLELHQGSTTIVSNDNWKTRSDGSSQQAEIEATTIPPTNDLESAIVATLSPGAYTAILGGKDAGAGVGLVEVYDLAQTADSKLANISTRGFVDTGDNVMIGGLIVGNDTRGTSKVIVRALGPSIPVTGALSDPTLELRDGSGTLISSNDNWKVRPDGSSQQAEIEATTIPPTNNLESALIATLVPGNYTAIVRGNGDTTGVGLVEVYNLR